MKNQFKILLAMLLVLASIFSFASCSQGNDDGSGNNGGDTGNNNSGEGEYDDTEDYLIRFVYSYTATVTNANGRTEKKTAVKTVEKIYVPVENSGFTDEIKSQIAKITYNGYMFDAWYSDWDKVNQTPKGDEFVYPTGAINGDITLYGSREDFRAGANAFFDIKTVYLKDDGTYTEPVATYPVAAENISEYEKYEVADVILTISGSGPMFDFNEANEIDVPWYQYSKAITKIVIEDGITTIGKNSFAGFKKLKSVDIGSGVTTIGNLAFANCTGTSFAKINVPANVTTICEDAFNNTGLKEVSLCGVVTIEKNAFKNSRKIRQLLVASTLKEVGQDAFHPGQTGSVINSHELNTGRVFFEGLQDAFASIAVSGGNGWFNEFPAIYYHIQDSKNLPSDASSGEGYWHYAVDADDQLITVDGIKIPVQYCYSVKYTVKNIKTPIEIVYVPVSEEYDENGELMFDDKGVVKLQGVVTKDLVDKQNAITYEGYKFAGFGNNALVEGDYIKGDRSIECQAGNALSDYNGIMFALSADKTKLTISKSATAQKKIAAAVEEEFASDYIRNLHKEAFIEYWTNEYLENNDGDVSSEELAALAEKAYKLELRTNESGIGNTYYSDFFKKVAWPKYENEAVAAATADKQLANSKIQAEVAARLETAYKIWNFETITATKGLWSASPADAVKITELVILDGVEYIGDNTFFGLTSLVEVVIPSSVKGISTSAFNGNTNLTYVYYDSADAETCYFYESGYTTTETINGKEVQVYRDGKIMTEMVDGKEVNVPITKPNKLVGVTKALVYTKQVENVDRTTYTLGNYWTEVEGSKLAWTVSNNGKSLAIGGSAEMVDFEISADAPWYWVGKAASGNTPAVPSAKELVTSVSFLNNVTKLGENAINGYYNVEYIVLPQNVMYLPQSSLDGTKVVTNVAGYTNGVLLINGCLINVDPAIKNTSHFDFKFDDLGIDVNIIAEGALSECDNIKTIFVTSTVRYINAGAFYDDTAITTIYTEVGPEAWKPSVAKDVNFVNANVYYQSNVQPAADATEKYYYKNGNEYMIWGCEHVWGEWKVEIEADCRKPGRIARVCLYDPSHKETKVVEKNNLHKWSDWVYAVDSETGLPYKHRSCMCNASEKRYLEGVTSISETTNNIVIPEGQTNWFGITYGENTFVRIDSEDVVVIYNGKEYQAKSNGEIWLDLPAISSGTKTEYIGIYTKEDVDFASISIDLVEATSKTVSTEENEKEIVETVTIRAGETLSYCIGYVGYGSIKITAADGSVPANVRVLYSASSMAEKQVNANPIYFESSMSTDTVYAFITIWAVDTTEDLQLKITITNS